MRPIKNHWGISVIAQLRSIVSHPTTDKVVTGLIIINAVILGLETSKPVMESYGRWLVLADHIILGIFVIEIAARLAVHRAAFFRDPWSLFDFAVVAIALVPASEQFSVLRALRVLRVLRLITTVPALKRVVAGLLAALPGMSSVVMLLALLYYVFSVMATKLFGDAFPEWFGSIGASAYSLFQIMTLESWSMGIVRPVMEKFPYAWAFFVPYIIVTTFAALNLFIGVVVNAMQDANAQAQAEEQAEQREAERAMIEAETGPLLGEMKRLQEQIEDLKAEVARRLPLAAK
ncbi:MAG: ion transporter [Alphaproteobacteria bacterium]|nr:ion transporter [Alphaproteobacteria bacterium]